MTNIKLHTTWDNRTTRARGGEPLRHSDLSRFKCASQACNVFFPFSYLLFPTPALTDFKTMLSEICLSALRVQAIFIPVYTNTQSLGSIAALDCLDLDLKYLRSKEYYKFRFSVTATVMASRLGGPGVSSARGALIVPDRAKGCRKWSCVYGVIKTRQKRSLLHTHSLTN